MKKAVGKNGLGEATGTMTKRESLDSKKTLVGNEKLMGKTTHSIDVNAPLRTVYNQWTQFEEFPRFMEGVEEVRQNGPANLFWKVRIGGKEKSWEAVITEQIPDQRIAWQSVDGTPNKGEVSFDFLDPTLTRVTLRLAYEPAGLLEEAGDALGFASGQVEKDLKRFRDFIEDRAAETGSWRGTIIEGKGPDLSATPLEMRSDMLDREVLRSEDLVPRHQSAGNEGEDLHGTSTAQAVKPPWESAASPFGPANHAAYLEQTDSIAPEYDRESDVILKPTHEQIAARAHQIYQARGAAAGHEVEDWLEAERQLSEESM
jgi:uncharacterized membrane protein